MQSERSDIVKHSRMSHMNSNKSFKCAICGYDNHIDIAHIKAVKDFDNESKISEIDSVDNLIALCSHHHWEYDHGILKLEL